MDSLAEWAHMGGYAIFVWSSYLLTGIVIVALAAVSWRNLRRVERELAEFEALQPRRRREKS